MKKKYFSQWDTYLGKTVHIKIDRPIGSLHPQYKDLVYPVNYGYLPDTISGDGEEIDVYLLGVEHPVQEYTARVIAVAYRMDDKEHKLIAAPEGMYFHAEQIRKMIHFQEQFFHTHIKLDPNRPVVTFYRNDPNAPRRTMPTRLGANAIITHNGQLLLERRRDSDTWGMVGGGVEKTETTLQAIVREVREELGLHISEKQFKKLKFYGEPGRIAAYRDGSVWQMVIAVFGVELQEMPQLKISAESRELRFFSKEELRNIEIVATHSDIVAELFIDI